MPTPAADRVVHLVLQLFAERGAAEYHGEAVTQTEHALQSAWLAEKAGATPELIVAALLHDVGHLLHGLGEDAAAHGLDDRHEELGYRFLTKHFGPAVCEPVRLHVPAKRYLCATDPAYRASLSPASETSLRFQGGPMTPDEAKAFEANPHFIAACDLRRWDDHAKVPGIATPNVSYFLRYLERIS
jgi:phosphonate degradation associated HDIG domain protein